MQHWFILFVVCLASTASRAGLAKVFIVSAEGAYRRWNFFLANPAIYISCSCCCGCCQNVTTDNRLYIKKHCGISHSGIVICVQCKEEENCPSFPFDCSAWSQVCPNGWAVVEGTLCQSGKRLWSSAFVKKDNSCFCKLMSGAVISVLYARVILLCQ